MVLDKDGRVIGLAGNSFWGLIPPSLPVGYVPFVVTIDSALELLTNDYGNQPWIAGAVGYTIMTENSATSPLRVPDNYQTISDAINLALIKLGSPVSLEQIQQTNPRFLWGPKAGTLFIAVFRSPVELKDHDGKLLAQGTWVGIAWNRPALPDVLFVGNSNTDIVTGFELSDVSTLNQAIHPQ